MISTELCNPQMAETLGNLVNARVVHLFKVIYEQVLVHNFIRDYREMLGLKQGRNTETYEQVYLHFDVRWKLQINFGCHIGMFLKFCDVGKMKDLLRIVNPETNSWIFEFNKKKRTGMQLK